MGIKESKSTKRQRRVRERNGRMADVTDDGVFSEKRVCRVSVLPTVR